MKRFLLVSFILTAISSSSCGKVGDPLPPVVRIPEAVSDFAVSQVGYQLQFTWTNPERNVDATNSTELTRAIIRADGEALLDVPVAGPGQPQSAEADARHLVGTSTSFSIQIESGSERLSAASPSVLIAVTAVPGPMTDLSATVDQGRIALSWSLPVDGRELIESIRVYRSGESIADLPRDATAFEDRRYVAEGTYTYSVVAVRSDLDGAEREGVASSPLEVAARDLTPPGAPRGLVLRVLEDGAFLTWDVAAEDDIAGYRVFRRDTQGGAFLPVTDTPMVVTGYNDSSYAPTYAYRVSAIDRSGNEGSLSEVVD